MNVWIWYRRQTRIENYHDEEQLRFYTKVCIKTQSNKKDILVIFTMQETKEFQFIWQKLYSREYPIAYST